MGVVLIDKSHKRSIWVTFFHATIHRLSFMLKQKGEKRFLGDHFKTKMALLNVLL